MDLELGLFDGDEKKFKPFVNPRQPSLGQKVSPMSPYKTVTYVPACTSLKQARTARFTDSDWDGVVIT